MSDKDFLAFDYVLGALDSSERREFDERLKQDSELRERVLFWEHNLDALNDPSDILTPQLETWHSIKTEINPKTTEESAGLMSWFKELSWLPWSLTGALSAIFAFFVIFGELSVAPSGTAGVDYVAVLTDKEGQAALTAVTKENGRVMFLKWGDVELGENQDFQIWAKSKRDQEIRSISIVADSKTTEISLSDAHWRLVTDAESLILTAEEEGGSAFDEPSDLELAKGICVRFSEQEAS